MKKLLLATTLLAGLMSSAQAQSVTITGNVLLQQCSRDPTNFCQGYVLGMASGTGICPDRTGSELVNVVLQYLRQNPDRRHLSGQEVVRDAYVASPQCKKLLAQKPPQPQPQPPSSSNDEKVFEGTSEEEVLLASAVAITMLYVKCGGDITAEQSAAVNKQLEKRGPMIAVVYKNLKSASCSVITDNYHKMIATLTARPS
jgi:hypothetical protein